MVGEYYDEKKKKKKKSYWGIKNKILWLTKRLWLLKPIYDNLPDTIYDIYI